MKSQFLSRGMGKYTLVVTGLASILGFGDARADVRLDVTYTTYQLRGLSRAAIHEDLHRVATKDRDGLIEGEMKDDWDWKFRLAATDDSCQVSSDEITLKLNILLPAWKDEARADPALRAVWKTYFDELKAHEDGHKTIAVNAAERISKLTHGATAPGSCAALENSLNSAAKQIVKTAEDEQERLDANDSESSALE